MAAAGLSSRRWSALFSEKISASGQTSLRWLALRRVDESPNGVNQRELSSMLGSDPPTMARLISALEAQGLIERVTDARDRRVNQLRTTSAAKPILCEGLRIGRELRAQMFEGFPLEDIKVAERVLTHACRRLEALGV